MKSEVLIDRHQGRILVTASAAGRCHDLTRRRKTGSRLPQDVHALADLGYLGLQHEHGLTVLPFKATQKHPLKATERTLNRVQSFVASRSSGYWHIPTATGADGLDCDST